MQQFFSGKLRKQTKHLTNTSERPTKILTIGVFKDGQ